MLAVTHRKQTYFSGNSPSGYFEGALSLQTHKICFVSYLKKKEQSRASICCCLIEFITWETCSQKLVTLPNLIVPQPKILYCRKYCYYWIILARVSEIGFAHRLVILISIIQLRQTQVSDLQSETCLSAGRMRRG